MFPIIFLGEPNTEQTGPDDVGVDLSQVDTSADNPITAVPLPNLAPPVTQPAPDPQPKQFQSNSWNKAPGAGKEYGSQLHTRHSIAVK